MSPQNQQSQGMAMKASAPYPPTTWSLGGAPEIGVDMPITAVFLFLFIVGAVSHMTIFQLNRIRGHKFLMSGLLFGFCMARIATTTLRIISIRFSKDVSLAIAAQVFVSAGVVIIYIINLLFAQRLMRASHPDFGWHKFFSIGFKIIYSLIIITIIMVIIVTVQSFYTLSPNIHHIDRDIQLYGVTYFAIVSFLPLPLIILGLVIPRRHKLDKFGQGRWRTKVRILLLSSFLICFGATYRAGTIWLTPVPRTEPLPGYFNKAAFYIVNFGVEIIVVLMYAILRVDRRFHIPNGARGPGSYSTNTTSKSKSTLADASNLSNEQLPSQEKNPEEDDETLEENKSEGRFSLPHVYSEEETFDEDEFRETAQAEQNKKDLEKGEPST